MGRVSRVGRVCEVAARDFASDHCSSAAAGLAFFGLVSGFPLLLLAVLASTLFLEPERAAAEAKEVLTGYVPLGSELVEGWLRGAVASGGTAAGLSALALLWSGGALFGQVSRALNAAWGVGVDRPWRRRILIDALLVLLSVALISAGMLYAAGTDGDALGPAAGLAPAALELAVALLLYRYVPRRPVGWRDACWGALAATALFQGSQRLFRSYVGAFGGRYEEVYGGLSGVVVLMVWAYIAALIFLFGAELSAACVFARSGRLRGEHAPTMERVER